jgi:probable HAF family extracellular repeat protein
MHAKTLVAWGMVLASWPASGWGARYAVTDLGAHRTPAAINDRGQILAHVFDPIAETTEVVVLDGDSVIRLLHPLQREIFAYDINNLGQVVGSIRDEVGRDHAFRWDPATGWHELETAPGRGSYAMSINDQGIAAGSVHGEAVFFFPDGRISKLGHLGGGYSAAFAVNDAMQAVGVSSVDTAGFKQHAFLWEEGAVADVTIVQSVSRGFQDFEIAHDINHEGVIVGYLHAMPDMDLWCRGTLFRGDEYGFIQDPAAGSVMLVPDARFLAVNDRGVAVGETWQYEPSGRRLTTAAVYRQGRLSDLNAAIPEIVGSDPSMGLTRATDINRHGQISAEGWVLASNGYERTTHGFLLTEVPEPSSWIGLTVAAGMVGIFGRRRRWHPPPDKARDPVIAFGIPGFLTLLER